MSAQDRASELLAELEAKAQASIASIQERSAQIKARLDDGVLNLQSAGPQPKAAAHSDPEVDLNWDFDAEANAEAQPAPPPPPSGDEPPLDDLRFKAPEPAQSFKDELDVATDEFGIPLGD